jgi:small multidrug resistance pump
MLAPVLLLLAIVAEVAATASLRAAGDGRPLAIAVVVGGYVGSLVLLAVIVRTMDVGVAYAVWAGLGTALIAAIGVVAFGEPASMLKLGSLALIIVGVVGLNLAGAH